MADVSPELLARIREEFSGRIETDARINELFEQTNGFSTASRAMNDYAQRSGEILAEVFEQELSSDVLPDGRMYWNIAENVVNPMLANNYELVTQACSQAIATLNEHAGIGIHPIVPEMNRDRIRGIDNLLANAEHYDDVAPQFREAVVNYSQSVATDAVRENADFQYRAGMSPKIIREAEASACEWCQALAGTYDYSKVRGTGNDVYRRHENCRCRVMYEPHRGSGRQDVHSKRWEEARIRQTVTLSMEETGGKLVTGARITDPFSDRAEAHAALYYPEIRKMSTDCDRIAEHTGFTVNQVRDVKNYLFMDNSYLDPDTGERRQFDPDFAIAQSWQRLTEGRDIQPHDRTLLRHELYEMQLKRDHPELTHMEAHRRASEMFDYPGETERYYDHLSQL